MNHQQSSIQHQEESSREEYCNVEVAVYQCASC